MSIPQTSSFAAMLWPAARLSTAWKKPSARLSSIARLKEGQAVAKGNVDRNLLCLPRRVLKAGPCVSISFADQFLMQPIDILDLDACCSPRAAVTMMLAQVQDTTVANDAHV